MLQIQSGVTDQYCYFVAVDDTTGARKTGLSSFTAYRSRNGGAATAYTTPTVTEVDATNMPGLYKFLLDEDMTIDAGDFSQEYALHIKSSGMLDVSRTILLVKPNVLAINGAEEAAADLAAGAASAVTGSAITGTLSSTQATTNLTEATNSHYVGRTIIWTSGVLKDSACTITAYTGASKLLTFSATPTGESPSNGDTFVIV